MKQLSARQLELQRQQHIQQGLAQINAIFGGGSYGTNPAAQYSPHKGGGFVQNGVRMPPTNQYYDASGNALNPATFDLKDKAFNDWYNTYNIKQHYTGDLNHLQTASPYTSGSSGERFIDFMDPATGQGIFGSEGTGTVAGMPHLSSLLGFGGQARPQITRQSVLDKYMKYLGGQGQLYTSKTTTPGFNDDFYNARKASYEAFALPQVSQQADAQQHDLAYRLADQGLLQSDAAGRLQSSLQRETQRQTQGVADQGTQLSQDLRANIENRRSSLISQLEASADPAASGVQAVAAANQFNAPSVYAPLGNLFSNWSNQYMANRQAAAYAPSIQNGYGQPWSQSSSNPATGASYSIRR